MVSSLPNPCGESSRFGGSPHFSVTGMLQDVRPWRDRHWAATSAAPPAEGSPLGLWIFPPPRWRRSQSVIAAGTTWRERPRLSRPGWGEPSTGAAALVAADGGASPPGEPHGGIGPRQARPLPRWRLARNASGRCFSLIAGIGSCARARAIRRSGNMFATILSAKGLLPMLMIGHIKVR